MTPRRSQRGLGVLLVVGFSTLLAFGLLAPGVPASVLVLSTAGILTGVAMCVRRAWSHLVAACASALVGAVFIVSGVTALMHSDAGVLTAIMTTGLGMACCGGSVLHVRAVRGGPPRR